MHHAFFIVGPTAVGKTELAVDLAERVGAEIVSADAFQIYRGLDLLTAKPTAEQQRRVRHHFIGCLHPSETYNVARFLEEARSIIDLVSQSGRSSLVVGGNGLYIKALTHGLSALPAADADLRAELDALPLTSLLGRLEGLDPATAAVIDVRNKRRLVRALEVCVLTGKPFSGFRTQWQSDRADPVVRPGVFLFRDRAELTIRIEQRVETMFAGGAVEEVRDLSGQDFSLSVRQIIGLAEITALIDQQMDSNRCREQIKIATRQYAKRQLTWFKRETIFEPINLSEVPTAAVQTEILYARYQAWRSSVGRPAAPATKALDAGGEQP